MAKQETTNVEIEEYDRIEQEIEGELEDKGSIEIDLKKTKLSLKLLRRLFLNKPVIISPIETEKGRTVKVRIEKSEIDVKVHEITAELEDSLPEIEKQIEDNHRYFVEGQLKQAQEFISQIDHSWSEKQYTRYYEMTVLQQMWERAADLTAEASISAGKEYVNTLNEISSQLEKSGERIEKLKSEFESLRQRARAMRLELEAEFRFKAFDLAKEKKNGSLGYVQELGKEEIRKEKEEQGLIGKVINTAISFVKKIFRL